MQLLITSATVALLASMLSLTTIAAPTQPEARQSSEPVVTFSGAGLNPPTYTLTPPFFGQNITIGKSSALVFSCPIAWLVTWPHLRTVQNVPLPTLADSYTDLSTTQTTH